MSKFEGIFRQAKIPKFYRIKRFFDSNRINDVGEAVRCTVLSSGCLNLVSHKKVAVAVGSRGIQNLEILVKETVDILKSAGADVFIVPAMGSQGGALAENQREMIESLGITEERMKVPIRSTMDTVIIGYTDQSEPVYYDRYATESDYTVSIVRVKPHTSYRGRYESGIVKMNVIGLGNQCGADSCHHKGMHKMATSLERFGKVSIEKSNLLFSVAVVENSYDQICLVEAIRKDEILEREPQLLEIAMDMLPTLPVKNLDLLIVDEMGKNIAGTGVDSNVIQRFTSDFIEAKSVAKCITVLDLTEETHGAANGMGLVDFATRRFADKIDFHRTYPNAITSRTPMAVRMPVIMENDIDAIRAGIIAAYDVDYDNPRIIRVKNTMRMDEMLVSEALLEDIHKIGPSISIEENPIELKFDINGNLTD